MNYLSLKLQSTHRVHYKWSDDPVYHACNPLLNASKYAFILQTRELVMTQLLELLKM